MKIDIAAPPRRYEVIYADPPWRYRNRGAGAAENHYQTMSLADIEALPVAELAAENAALFLWTTFPQLPEALEVIKAWGFCYKTGAFTWVKMSRGGGKLFWGLGFWTRANAEICLLAVKGKPHRQSTRVHSVIISPVEEHSKKPDEVRRRIAQLMGDEKSKVELFARQAVPGWDCWGNEV